MRRPNLLLRNDPSICNMLQIWKNPWNEVLSIFHIHHYGLDFLRVLMANLRKKFEVFKISLKLRELLKINCPKIDCGWNFMKNPNFLWDYGHQLFFSCFGDFLDFFIFNSTNNVLGFKFDQQSNLVKFCPRLVFRRFSSSFREFWWVFNFSGVKNFVLTKMENLSVWLRLSKFCFEN
jgi:hypothetical protein